jgi:hypothetical protein
MQGRDTETAPDAGSLRANARKESAPDIRPRTCLEAFKTSS